MATCDAQIAEVNIFGFYDDAPRGRGFQAALNEVDGTPRPSAGAVRAAIAQSSTGCSKTRVAWHPAAARRRRDPPGLAATGRPDGRPLRRGGGRGRVGRRLPAPGLGWEAIAAERAMRARTPKSPGCTGGEALPARPVRIRLERSSPLRPMTVAVRLVAEGSQKRVSTFSRTFR